MEKKASLVRKDYEKKIMKSLDVASDIFDRTSRDLWRCDPDTFIEGENYLQITRLLQGQLENEKDLNGERSCTQTCENFQIVEKEFGCSERSICNQQPKCQGKLLYCTTVEDDLWVCPSLKQSSRRYEFIQYNNGKTWGERTTCKNQWIQAEEYWLYNVLWRCDHCLCICDEQSKKSDRFFSLRQSVSDIKNNM
jgi:hypothetical protein